MSAFSHCTEDAQAGGVAEEVIVDHDGLPERDSDITVQLRATAALQIRDPVFYRVSGDFDLEHTERIYLESRCLHRPRFSSVWT